MREPAIFDIVERKRSMAKKTGRLGYQPYPEADDARCGCKVGWRTYKDRAKAEECSKAAKVNAAIDAGLGYDFGYQMPESIKKLADGRFEVCIP
jgi:hypothetical protein